MEQVVLKGVASSILKIFKLRESPEKPNLIPELTHFGPKVHYRVQQLCNSPCLSDTLSIL